MSWPKSRTQEIWYSWLVSIRTKYIVQPRTNGQLGGHWAPPSAALKSFEHRSSGKSNQPLSLLNPTASPEKIELRNVSFQSLQISWNRLTSAKVNDFDLEDLTQLFQHALQMTFCDVSSIRRRRGDSSMPLIIHHKLKTLLHLHWHVPPVFFDSLTLPCLQSNTTSCPCAPVVLSFDKDHLFLLFRRRHVLRWLATFGWGDRPSRRTFAFERNYRDQETFSGRIFPRSVPSYSSTTTFLVAVVQWRHAIVARL